MPGRGKGKSRRSSKTSGMATPGPSSGSPGSPVPCTVPTSPAAPSGQPNSETALLIEAITRLTRRMDRDLDERGEARGATRSPPPTPRREPACSLHHVPAPRAYAAAGSRPPPPPQATQPEGPHLQCQGYTRAHASSAPPPTYRQDPEEYSPASPADAVREILASAEAWHTVRRRGIPANYLFPCDLVERGPGRKAVKLGEATKDEYSLALLSMVNHPSFPDHSLQGLHQHHLTLMRDVGHNRSLTSTLNVLWLGTLFEMGFLTNCKTWFVMHLLLGYIFIMSGLITCLFLLISYICLWHVNKRLYRKFATRIAYLWWSQFTFLGQWWAPSKCHIFFENPKDFHKVGTDHTIVIMNHKYEVDWLMTMMLAERYGILGGTKIYGKAMLKHIPILGWAWSFTESIFLKREWTTDKKNLIKDLAYICDYPDDYWVTLLLFCEGTRFTETKLELSNKVAREKGLKELKHHLLPRTKGFVLSINGVKDHIETITDLTVGFRNEGTDPTMMNLLNGRGLCAEIYVRRIPTKSVPVESDVQTAEWLHRLYQEKDEIFDNFKSNGNHFTIGTCIEVPRRRRDLVTWCTWAVVLLVPLFHCIVNIIVSGSLLSQGILVVVMALLTLCIKLLIGVTHIEKGSDYGSSPVHQPNKVVHAKSL